MQMELNLKDVSARRDDDRTEPTGAAAQSSDESSEEPPWLEVQFTELQAAIRGMRKLARAKEQAEAVVSFADGKIVIELPAIAVRASAEGVWPGEARVPASFVQGLARSITTSITESETVRFQVEDERLSLGNYSTPLARPDRSGSGRIVPTPAATRSYMLPSLLILPLMDPIRPALMHRRPRVGITYGDATAACKAGHTMIVSLPAESAYGAA